MIVLSYNVRGLGGRVKRKVIKDLVVDQRVDFLAIQESKLEVVTDTVCRGLWGGDDCDWAFLPSIGNSGGIISIWRKSESNLLFSVVGEGFVGVCLEWGWKKEKCFVLNIYSKCDLVAKQRLWANLVLLRNSFGDRKWCMVGDFNAVSHVDERRGVSSVTSSAMVMEINLFNSFMLDVDLFDMSPLGRKFTWYHASGNAMSRIDRVLISDSWNSGWGIPSLWVLPRTISDHCPLVLKYGNLDWGPKPFRFNTYWLENKLFKKLVEDSWRNQRASGWMAVVLKTKLKGLKDVIRGWSKHEYGNLDSKVACLVAEIGDLDVKGELGVLSSEEVGLRKEKFDEMWKLLKCKEASLFQRSRSKWLKEGDENSKYFHRCVKARAAKNSLKAIKVDGGWVDTPVEVRRAVVDYFKIHVAEDKWDRPTLDGVPFDTLSEEDNRALIAPFSLEEIEVVVKESDGNKSPGPDGFNFAFFKEFWYLLKYEIRMMFDQFYANEVLPKSFLSFFVALIPKVNVPLSLKDYRPISLLGSL